MSNIVIQGNSSGSGTTTLQSGNTSATYTYTLPTADGTNGQVMQTNGSGQFSWTNPGVSAGKSIALTMVFAV